MPQLAPNVKGSWGHAAVLYKLEKWIPVTLLLLLGLAGVIIGGSAFLELHWFESFKARIPHLVYATVGLLALSLGIERLLPFHRWEMQLNRMEKKINTTAKDLLEKSSWAWFLAGERIAFEAAIDICQDAEEEIRALALGASPRVQGEFAEAIVNLLKAKDNTSLKFTSVYSVDFNKLPPSFHEDAQWRIKLHEERNVSAQVKLLFIDQKPQIGLHCFLVDHKHTIIGVSDPDTRKYKGVLLFRNQPQITRQFVAWFEDAIMPHAIDYEEQWPSINKGSEKHDAMSEPNEDLGAREPTRIH